MPLDLRGTGSPRHWRRSYGVSADFTSTDHQ